jgi:hypothetical protein
MFPLPLRSLLPLVKGRAEAAAVLRATLLLASLRPLLLAATAAASHAHSLTRALALTRALLTRTHSDTPTTTTTSTHSATHSRIATLHCILQGALAASPHSSSNSSTHSLPHSLTAHEADCSGNNALKVAIATQLEALFHVEVRASLLTHSLTHSPAQSCSLALA